MNRRLRVLQAFEPSAGGLPEHVAQASVGLLDRGHQVVVAGPADARGRAAVEAAGGTWIALPWAGSVPAPAADRAVVAGLRDVLRDSPPDVAHAHGQKAGMLLRPVAARHGVATVYTPHTLVYRTQTLRPRRGTRARFLLGRALERRLGGRTTVLAGCCEDERAAAVQDGLVPEDRSRVVYCGVKPDLGAQPAQELVEARADGPLLGFVASLREQKGLPVLLDALEALARRGDPVRFAIVGSGPLEAEVAARIAGGPLRESTVLLPFGGRVEPYLAALDGFVLPSLWEGLPIAVLEAMAFGLPVIASDVNGTPEAVRHGESGLLVAPQDPQALASAIHRVAGDAGLRERLGRAGREVVERRFTLQRMIDASESLLGDAAALGPPGGILRR